MAQEQDDKYWGELYQCLFTFTHKLLKKKHWFRGTSDGSSIKGKEVHDYVDDALALYFANPEKHDPKKGSLADYINFNIIRTLVRNDAVSAENRKTLDLFVDNPDEEEAGSTYLESMLSYTEALIDQQMDYDAVIAYIEQQAQDDSVVESILLGLNMDLKRREIMKEFNIEAREYDNGKRRLETILKNTASKFQIQNSTS
ncbi:hypothetical protein [Hymenobacter edaphi]|uniref:Uncharacterized protein n=1 Tax=Hymenobacter edaphi TaxID=2211146 RepID=A0A328B5X8_9BACT|nr:hypothetical protein [Hymenobacter edaphi]RAK61995.1 hypothetical protein DLM85_24645 [Hymenobacter edaphi]